MAHTSIRNQEADIYEIVQQQSRCVTGLGKFKNVEVWIHLQEHARAVAHPPTRVPAHLREATERELQTQLVLGIIEPVTGPTPWIARIIWRNHTVCRDMRLESAAAAALKKMATEPDETIKLLMWSKEKLFLSFP